MTISMLKAEGVEYTLEIPQWLQDFLQQLFYKPVTVLGFMLDYDGGRVHLEMEVYTEGRSQDSISIVKTAIWGDDVLDYLGLTPFSKTELFVEHGTMPRLHQDWPVTMEQISNFTTFEYAKTVFTQIYPDVNGEGGELQVENLSQELENYVNPWNARGLHIVKPETIIHSVKGYAMIPVVNDKSMPKLQPMY